MPLNDTPKKGKDGKFYVMHIYLTEFFFFLAVPHGLWDPSSLTRD